MKTAVL